MTVRDDVNKGGYNGTKEDAVGKVIITRNMGYHDKAGRREHKEKMVVEIRQISCFCSTCIHKYIHYSLFRGKARTPN